MYEYKFFIFILLLIVIIIFIIYLQYKPHLRGGVCTIDNNCASNLICDNGTCIYNPALNITVFPGDVCYGDSECPSNYYCSNTGNCLENPHGEIGEPCKLDQECTINNYCHYTQTCKNGSSIYYVGSNNPTYFQLTLDEGITVIPAYMGKINTNDNSITTSDTPIEESKLIYNGDSKTLFRPNLDMLVFDDNGKLVNLSTNTVGTPIPNNQIYFKFANISELNISNPTNFSIISEEAFVMLDKFGNIIHLYQDEFDISYFSTCNDNIHYINNPSCDDGKLISFVIRNI